MSATVKIDFYLCDFISDVQVGPKERRQLLWRIFHKIYRLFLPNKETDTDSKEPISLKKVGQVDGAWSTQKTVLG